MIKNERLLRSARRAGLLRSLALAALFLCPAVALLPLAGCASTPIDTDTELGPEGGGEEAALAPVAVRRPGESDATEKAVTGGEPVGSELAATVSRSATPAGETAASSSSAADHPLASAEAASDERRAVATAAPAETLASLEATWGVKVLGVRLTAAGQMLDYRYRVSDPEKAAPLFHRRTKPYLVDEERGLKLSVPNPPKVGPLRAMNNPEPDRNYFVLFSNPGAALKKGSKVTVVIGDFRAEHLIVH